MGLVLPPLIKYENFESDEDFLTTLYEFFQKDFIFDRPKYKGTPLRLKRMPFRNNREATFYHITTKGKDENNRQIDIPRAERIRWIKPIIESDDKILLTWENSRKNEENILILHPIENFLVILRKRNNGLMFWTAYYIDACYKHKLIKEYNNYQNKLKTPLT